MKDDTNDTRVDAAMHPASFIAHWSSGPVYCCLSHADGLKKLGAFMGLHVHVEPYMDGAEPCSNCVNEAKKAK